MGFYHSFFFSKNKTLNLKTSNLDLKLAVLGSLIYTCLILIFPIVVDFYGDAYKMHQFLEITPQSIPQKTHEYFFSYSITPWAGQNTTYALVTYISYFFQVTYKSGFYILNSIFGSLFVFSWIYFISKYIKINTWKVILIVTGLSAPFMLNFFGHFEVYSIVLFFTLLWMILAFHQLKTHKKSNIFLLLILLIICIKFHALSLLLLPAYFILLWKHFKGNYLTWKQVKLYIVLPIFIAGAILYFFIFKDHIDTRSLHNNVAMEYDHIFLPLFSPEAPLDKYNLLSLNHIFDYFQEILLWSTIALFLITTILTLFRKQINFNHPTILISSTTLLLYGSLFFVINPLLSMPMDWDLFSLPAPILLMLTVALVKQIEYKVNPRPFLATSLILALLNIPFFLIHTSEKALSQRLENVGIHIYNSYYEWSAQTLERAMSLDNRYEHSKAEHHEQLLQKLQPIAIIGNDREYAKMLTNQGRYNSRIVKDYDKAISYFSQSEEYHETNNNKLLKLEAYFQSNDYENAYTISKELVKLSYPNEKKAYRVAIHCALETNSFNEAKEFCKYYISHWPDDATIQEAHNRLINNDRVSEIKKLFRRI